MPTVTCPNCRDAVEIESDWYGRRVVCPSCDHRFVAEQPGRRDEFDDDRPRGSTVRLVVVLSGGNNLSAADRDKFLPSVRIGKGK